MRKNALIALLSTALAVSALAGTASKRASQPNPVNGPARVLSEVAR